MKRTSAKNNRLEALRRLIASSVVAVLVGPLAPNTGAAPLAFSFAEVFATDDDVFVHSFSISADAPLDALTFSYGSGVSHSGSSISAGGFAPILSLFSADGGQLLLQLGTGSANACGPGSGAPDPTTGFCWDAQLSVPLLPAGDYLIALSQDGNPPLGPTFSDGFLQAGVADFTGQAPEGPVS